MATLKMYDFYHFSAIVIATLSLALSYFFQSAWLGAGLILLSGVLWLSEARKDLPWLASVMMLVFFGLGGYGAWLGYSSGLILIGIIATLAAWDMAYFWQHLQPSSKVEKETALKQAYLNRLGLVVGASFLLGSLALLIQFELNLGWALVVGFIVIITLGRVMRGIRAKG